MLVWEELFSDIKKCWIPILGGYVFEEVSDNLENSLNLLLHSLQESHPEEVNQILDMLQNINCDVSLFIMNSTSLNCR